MLTPLFVTLVGVAVLLLSGVGGIWNIASSEHKDFESVAKRHALWILGALLGSLTAATGLVWVAYTLLQG